MSYDILSKDKLEYTLGKIKEKIDASEGGGVDVEADGETLIFTGGSKSNEVKLADRGSEASAIRFGIDSDGNYGYYKVGADTLTPFKSGSGTLDIFNHGDVVGLNGIMISPRENTSFDCLNEMYILSNNLAGITTRYRLISSDLSYIRMEEIYYKMLLYPVVLNKKQYHTIHIDIEVPSGRSGSFNSSRIDLINASSMSIYDMTYLTNYEQGIYTFDRQIVDIEIPDLDDGVYLQIFNCDDILNVYSIWVD